MNEHADQTEGIEAQGDGGIARWILFGGVMCMFLLVVYVLSPGPIRMLLEMGALPSWIDPVLEVVWTPLIYLYEQHDTVERFYDAYFEWCIGWVD